MASIGLPLEFVFSGALFEIVRGLAHSSSLVVIEGFVGLSVN
jgi:hypothetical protein